jgi:murein DD-endopeptidase MepM/ murein hydrolase activator NlpD
MPPAAVRLAGPLRKNPAHRKQFSLLIVRGDGARVIRFNVPRRLLVVSLIALAAGLSALGAVLGDYVELRRLTRDARTLVEQVAEQRAVIDGFNRRVAGLREEVASWRDVHGRIWEPFGPEGRPRAARAGIGGAVASTAERAVGAAAVGDELARLAEALAEEGHSLRALERLMAKAGKALAALPNRWPVRGAVNSEFGNRLSPWGRSREFHGGLDISAGPGTAVHAPAPGTVVFAGRQSDYGIAVIVDHGNEVRTLYGHLTKPLVAAGEKVERGGVVGLTGNTGRSSGPHLHYEVQVKGKTVNPRAYLWN